MPEKPTGLVQGTLDMIILKTLALQPMHGYGIALRIGQVSDGEFQVNPGSLFPALSRLQRSGDIDSEWRCVAAHMEAAACSPREPATASCKRRISHAVPPRVKKTS